MKPKNIPLGKILNIPIQLDYSWFLIFILLTWSLATSYFPALYKSWTPLLYWVIGGATSLLLFVSVLLHELGHSVLALRYKIPVRKITLFIFGGVAQITRAAECRRRILDCNRRSSRQFYAGGYFLRPATPGAESLTASGVGKIPGLY
jgi:Zn-dependent protease